jgi:hypothetical protein
MSSFGAAIAVAPVLGSTSVTSAGSVLPGGTSAGAASFTLTENAIAAFPNASGSVTVTITDSSSAPTVRFSGTPVLSAPGSLGATVSVGSNAFTVNIAGADNSNIEPITVSGLRITALAGAAAGPIKAAMTGSLVGGIVSATAIATGTVQSLVIAGATSGVVVNVSSPCGFAATGGLNTDATFSDVADSRPVATATALAAGQQTLTFGAGVSAHVAGTTVTQTVADCLGANLGSPGTVGAGSPTQHLAFTTQPGGGAAGAVWAQQPVVAVRNTLSQVVTTDNSTVVTLSIATNPAGGTLSCTSGLSRTVINGVATFSGCSINLGAATAYTLSATSNPAWTAAVSNGFLVGATQNLAFTVQPGGGAAGVVWAQQPVVAVRNSLSQVVTTDNSTVVTLSIGTNPAGGTLFCSSGLTRTVVNGIATFFGCQINVGSLNFYTLRATSSPAWNPATSLPFAISPTLQSVAINDWIAPGVNRGTAGFGTASVIVPPNGYATLLGTTSPNLAGSIVQIWTRTKTGAWRVLTSRVVAGDGTIHYFARINAWTAYQFKFVGDATRSPAASHGRIATVRN